MAENILVCVAWPYVNGLQHIGHIAGAYLPPDIFARYHRQRMFPPAGAKDQDVHRRLSAWLLRLSGA